MAQAGQKQVALLCCYRQGLRSRLLSSIFAFGLPDNFAVDLGRLGMTDSLSPDVITARDKRAKRDEQDDDDDC